MLQISVGSAIPASSQTVSRSPDGVLQRFAVKPALKRDFLPQPRPASNSGCQFAAIRVDSASEARLFPRGRRTARFRRHFAAVGGVAGDAWAAASLSGRQFAAGRGCRDRKGTDAFVLPTGICSRWAPAPHFRWRFAAEIDCKHEASCPSSLSRRRFAAAMNHGRIAVWQYRALDPCLQ